MTFLVIGGVIKESSILNEFGQSRSLAFSVLLLPIGPISLLVLPFRLGWFFAVIVAFLCFLPTLIISRNLSKVLECSGTDRTRRIEKTATQAFFSSCVGMVYVAIFLVFMLIAEKLSID